jgi:hypothetical protein
LITFTSLITPSALTVEGWLVKVGEDLLAPGLDPVDVGGERLLTAVPGSGEELVSRRSACSRPSTA